MKKRIVIIGGGASGLMAAIQARQSLCWKGMKSRGRNYWPLATAGVT